MPSGLSIGKGLALGFEKASSNFMAAVKAAQDAKIQKQKNEIEFKKGELEIKKLEFDVDPDMLKEKRDLLKQQRKTMTEQANLKIAYVDLIKSKTTKELEQARRDKQFFDLMSSRPDFMQYAGFSGGKVNYTPPAAMKAANIPPDVYQSMQKEAVARAKKVTTNKTKHWYGEKSEPTAQDVDTQMRDLIQIYRSQNPQNLEGQPPPSEEPPDGVTDSVVAGEFDPNARLNELFNETGDEDEAYKKLAEEMKEKGISL